VLPGPEYSCEIEGIERELVRRAILTRRFEELLLRLFSKGKLNGTVHTCIGQEWSGLAVARASRPGDTIFSNHRGHGHYLAFRDNTEGLLAEVMGRATGLCGGIGGSQHLCDNGFFSNGVLGGMSPVALGSAWSHKRRERGDVAIVFHGDGALGEGAVYESMNLASRWGLPVVWVIERNGYAQSTDCRGTHAGTIGRRAAAFDIPHFSGDTWHPQDLIRTAAEAVGRARMGGGPVLLEIATYRLAAHSKGDDTRPAGEIADFHARDPLNRLLAGADPDVHGMDSRIMAHLEALAAKCEGAPLCAYRPEVPEPSPDLAWTKVPDGAAPGERYAALLNEALAAAFASDPDLVMIGEDIEGPYGGAFKVSRDLSQRFEGRVRNTPISEAAIAGMGAGMALGGGTAIVEIMFGDFLSLIFDQLLQHACKFEVMFGGAVRVPLVVRTPMGGRRGYGPTHSQSIEAHFLGIPGLDVLALNGRVAPGEVYGTLLGGIRRPTLVVENKVLYTRQLKASAPTGFEILRSNEVYPTTIIRPHGTDAAATLLCYGGMLEVAEAALGEAFTELDTLCELVCPVRIAPVNIEPILESVRSTGRLLVLEEGKTFAAYGSEVLARLVERGVRFKARRLGYDGCIPACFELENRLLVNKERILGALGELLRE